MVKYFNRMSNLMTLCRLKWFVCAAKVPHSLYGHAMPCTRATATVYVAPRTMFIINQIKGYPLMVTRER